MVGGVLSVVAQACLGRAGKFTTQSPVSLVLTVMLPSMHTR